MLPERRMPKPFPVIEPQWEYAAEPDLSILYDDYKTRLQVPWVGVVSMAYARYRRFFECWWSGLRDVVDTEPYVNLSLELRALVEELVLELDPPPIADRFSDLGYSEREIGNIRDIIEFLSHGNFIQIPAVFLARLLLENGEFNSGGAPPAKYPKRHAVACETPFVLIEPHHVLPDMSERYGDVMDRLRLPFVNTDYRALARWPTYFDLAWSDLRGHIGASGHERLARRMHDTIFDMVRNLPNPSNLDARTLIQAAQDDGDLQQILDTTRVFSHLLPGLTVNVAFFRHQLLERRAG